VLNKAIAINTILKIIFDLFIIVDVKLWLALNKKKARVPLQKPSSRRKACLINQDCFLCLIKDLYIISSSEYQQISFFSTAATITATSLF